MHLRFVGVRDGRRPRLAPLCLLGNQSGSASTLATNSESDPFCGQPPPCFVSLLATQSSLTVPLWISLLASRKANALACSQGQSLPGAAACHIQWSCDCGMGLQEAMWPHGAKLDGRESFLSDSTNSCTQQ